MFWYTVSFKVQEIDKSKDTVYERSISTNISTNLSTKERYNMTAVTVKKRYEKKPSNESFK